MVGIQTLPHHHHDVGRQHGIPVHQLVGRIVVRVMGLRETLRQFLTQEPAHRIEGVLDRVVARVGIEGLGAGGVVGLHRQDAPQQQHQQHRPCGDVLAECGHPPHQPPDYQVTQQHHQQGRHQRRPDPEQRDGDLVHLAAQQAHLLRRDQGAVVDEMPELGELQQTQKDHQQSRSAQPPGAQGQKEGQEHPEHDLRCDAHLVSGVQQAEQMVGQQHTHRRQHREQQMPPQAQQQGEVGRG